MRICWILVGLWVLFQFSKSLCVYNAYDPKAVTIIVNCTIPFLVALVLSLMNELKFLAESLMKEDE